MARIIFDFDGVLAPCASIAAKWAGIDMDEITDYDLRKTAIDESRIKKFYEVFKGQDFYREQSRNIYPEMIELLKKLSENHEIIIATDVFPEGMEFRLRQIREYFPFIELKNVMIGGRKDLLTADIIVDDNPYVLLNSMADEKILVSKPYNSGRGYLYIDHSFTRKWLIQWFEDVF